MKRVLAAVAYTGCCLVVPSGQALSSTGPIGGASAAGGGGWRPPSAPNPQGSDSTAPATGYAVGGGGGSGNPDGSYCAPPPSNTYSGQQFGTEVAIPPEQQQQQQQQQGPGLHGGGGYYEPPPDYQQQKQPPPSHEYQQPNPYLPRHSRWAGQHHAEPPLSQQQYGHGYRSQRPHQPEPLRLGTKWRSVVSRVKDAVRPGQPMGYEQGRYYQGDGGWGEGDGGNGFRGYPPGAPSWGQQRGAAPQNLGEYASSVDGAYGQQRTGGEGYADSYGLERQQQRGPALGGYEQQQEAAPYGTQQDQVGPDRYPPPTFSSRTGSSAGVTEQGYDGGRGWQPSSPPESFYIPGGSGGDLYGAEQAVDGGGGSHGYGDSSIAAVGSGVGVVQEERQGQGPDTIAHGVAPASQAAPQDQYAVQHRQEGPYGEQAVGQGWAPATPEPAYAAPPPQQQQEDGDRNDAVEGGERAPPVATPISEPPSSPPLYTHMSQAVGCDDAVRGTADYDDGGSAVGAAEYTFPSGTPDSEGLAESTTSSSRVETAHPGSIGNPNDPMPSSADHGLEKVDWGEGVEEDDRVLSVGHDEEDEREEEEALIRELERMDGIGGGELDAVARPADDLLPEEVEDADEAMEHTLDVLFDSIREDESTNNGYGSDLDIGINDNEDFAAPVAPAAENRLADDGFPAPSAAHAPGTDRTGTDHLEEHVPVEGGDAAAGVDHHPKQQQQEESWHEYPSDSDTGSSSSRGLNGPANDEDVDDGEDAKEKLQESAAAAEGVGSLWGKKGRWESLPAHAVVVHEPGDEKKIVAEAGGEEEVDDEDEVDIFIPLDPIELPPSAASDEIWNDQHLQDQLDAYWEQSRRATGGGRGGGGGSGAGVGYASSLFPGAGANARQQQQQQQQQQQLSRLPGSLQPTYGPGDWVGKGAGPVDWLSKRQERGGVTEMMVQQEPLPGTVVDGVPRPGSNWVTPNLFQGNQAPINIYGNVHVHLPSGQQNSDQQSSELGARERYYSQGETSWSGSERGSQ